MVCYIHYTSRIMMWYNVGCPRVIRADYGTENSVTAKIHIALRIDQEDGQRCFFYGPSTANIVGLLPTFTMALVITAKRVMVGSVGKI